MTNNRNKAILYGMVTWIIVAVFLFAPTKSSALTGLRDYYGGTIQKVTYCTCYYDPGVVLEIRDYSRNYQTIKVFYSPFLSRLWAYYNIWVSGPYVVGGYTIGSRTCKNTSGYYCTNSGTTADGTIDWIRGIGTSIK